MDQPDENAVFINMPYDNGYERIFISIIAALISIGRTPRCTLEIAERGQGRIERIHSLIESCRVSIHDLSCLKQPVRFNMPFELGLACALSRLRGNHSYIILERMPYRIDKTLSDIKGCDPYIYKGSMKGAVHCVIDALGKDGQQADLNRVHRLSIDLWKIAEKIKTKHKIETVFNRTAYHLIVAAGVQYAVDRKFIPEL